MDAVSAAAVALTTLLAPLSWEGVFLPTLPPALDDVLGAPTPLIAGVAALPEGWVQDEETLVVLLDKETLRIPVRGARGGAAAAAAAAGTAAAAAGALDAPSAPPVPDLLALQPPGASALVHALAPRVAALVDARDGALRPCYRPSPAQAAAAAAGVAALNAAVAGFVDAVLAAGGLGADAAPPAGGGDDDDDDEAPPPPLAAARARLLARAPEAEAPFWARFCDTQMVAGAYDAAAAARAGAALAARAAGAAALARALSGGADDAAPPPPAAARAPPPPPPVPPPGAPAARWTALVPSGAVVAVRPARARAAPS